MKMTPSAKIFQDVQMIVWTDSNAFYPDSTPVSSFSTQLSQAKPSQLSQASYTRAIYVLQHNFTHTLHTLHPQIPSRSYRSIHPSRHPTCTHRSRNSSSCPSPDEIRPQTPQDPNNVRIRNVAHAIFNQPNKKSSNALTPSRSLPTYASCRNPNE